MADFDELVTEAVAAPFSGWDLSWLDRRWRSEPLPWDYGAPSRSWPAVPGRCWTWARVVARYCPGCRPGPDRPSRPRHGRPTCRWPAERLLPLGIPVIQVEGARDNVDQDGANDGGRLPFRDGSLDLICNRHESFLAAELCRVLAAGGTFVTQQVDYHDNDDLAQMLGIEMPEEPDSWIGWPNGRSPKQD